MQVKASAAAVFEVERAVQDLAARRVQGVAEGRAGLARGSRLEALAEDLGSAKDKLRAEMLARVGAERRVRLEAAIEAHRGSRVESRQVDGLVERVKASAQLEDERRAQAESDDRFLSRREWLRAHRS